jgi:hypothetical protein
MQEKLLFVLNGKCLFLQGVPEHGLYQSLAPSLCSLATLQLLQNEIAIDLLHEGALRALPSNLPTLFNYIEWVV